MSKGWLWGSMECEKTLSRFEKAATKKGRNRRGSIRECKFSFLFFYASKK
jgi:hypothetical protein